MSTLWTPSWVCCRCESPIDDDPHTDPHTGEDVHAGCCAACSPEAAERYGVDVVVTTDALRDALEAVAGPTLLRHDDGRLLIAGHGGGLTQDQAARAEQTRAEAPPPRAEATAPGQPTLRDSPDCCASRHFGPPCTSTATCEVRTGCGRFAPHCDRCADGVRAWAGSPAMSGLRYERRPLGATS